MPTTPQGDRTHEFDTQFLQQFKDTTQPAPASPLATPDQMLVVLTLLVGAIVKAQLPELGPKMRELMTGQLTPGVRELILTVIQLMTDHPDIAKEAGFGPEVFDHIARSDVELENLGSTLNDLVVSLMQAEGQQRAALLTFNSQAMLTAVQMLDELKAAEQREEHDRLLAKFRSALNRQAELSLARSDARTGSPTAPTVAELKAELELSTRDAGVRHSVATIQQAARLLAGTGKLPLLTTGQGAHHTSHTSGSQQGTQSHPAGKGQGQ